METRPQPSLRARLVDAALAALDRGEEVGLRAIARTVGVSAMTPYRHFADKAALLDAVVAQGFEDLRTVLEQADGMPTARDALVAQGLAYLGFARARPTLFRLMFSGRDLAPGTAVAETGYDTMVRRVRELRPTDPDAAILACWSSVHGMATLAIDGGLDMKDQDRERAALALVVAGLASG